MHTDRLPTRSEIPGKDKAAFLDLARKRYATGETYWQPNFLAAEEDIVFAYSEQWDAEARAARKSQVCLTLNKIPTFIDQVVGDQRQNRPSIQVHAVEADQVVSGNVPSPVQQPGQQAEQQASVKRPNISGNKDYSEAEVREGLIRNIEYQSNADTCYDIAFQHAVESGMGWLRVYTQYADDDVFEQDIVINSIKSRFSVIMDPEATSDPSFATANWCFVTQWMRNEEFRDRYKESNPSSLGDPVGDYESWYTDARTRIAEYYYREPVTRRLLLLSDRRVVWYDEIKEVLDELAEIGVTVVRERKVESSKVYWAKITGMSILEGPTEVPFPTIPIVPVLGKEHTLENYTFYRGLIRYAKDAQRMHNYWMSAATERVALAPKSPYILDARSIEGFEQMWQRANTRNWSYLPYNASANVPPPRREQPPSMPAAELQLALAASDEIKAVIGLFDASLGIQGNETSGKAILARQRQGDRGTFAFIDNLVRAQRQIGKLLLHAIPRVYDTERVIRLKFVDDTEDWVRINETVVDRQSGKRVQVHDISAGKYDVTVASGPSYQTQRMEAADTLMQFVQAVPQAGSVVLDLIAKNMDWPGADKIAKRLKKIIPPNILDPDEMAEEGIQPPQPTPEQQAEMAKSQADIAKAEAEKVMANAKAIEAQAKIAEIQALDGGGMTDTVRQLVADAIAEFIDQQKNSEQQKKVV